MSAFCSLSLINEVITSVKRYKWGWKENLRVKNWKQWTTESVWRLNHKKRNLLVFTTIQLVNFMPFFIFILLLSNHNHVMNGPGERIKHVMNGCSPIHKKKGVNETNFMDNFSFQHSLWSVIIIILFHVSMSSKCLFMKLLMDNSSSCRTWRGKNLFRFVTCEEWTKSTKNIFLMITWLIMRN